MCLHLCREARPTVCPRIFFENYVRLAYGSIDDAIERYVDVWRSRLDLRLLTDAPQHGAARIFPDLAGHVRDTFVNAVDEFLNRKYPEPTVEFEVNCELCSIPISRACTLVWNCTDIAPEDLVFDLLNDAELKINSRTDAACPRAMHDAIQSRCQRKTDFRRSAGLTINLCSAILSP
jgi:hypothetical protein